MISHKLGLADRKTQRELKSVQSTQTQTNTQQKQDIFHLIPPLFTERKVWDAWCFHRRWHHHCGHLWPITIIFIVHNTHFHHLSSISSSSSIAYVYMKHRTDVWLMLSYKFEETHITLRDTGFEPLQIGNYMRNIGQTKCPLHRLWCLTTGLAIQQQRGVIPVRLHVQYILFNFRVRRAEVGSNSCTGHSIFYGKVCQCDLPVSQRLTKNSLLQGESVALQRQPETPH